MFSLLVNSKKMIILILELHLEKIASPLNKMNKIVSFVFTLFVNVCYVLFCLFVFVLFKYKFIVFCKLCDC